MLAVARPSPILFPLKLEILLSKMKNRGLRNIVIFIVIALASGWIGVFVDSQLETQPEGDTLGMGIWLILPLLTTLFLRAFAGDGWKDFGLKPHLKRNLKWYFIAILIYPLVTALILLIGKLPGWVDFSGFKIELFIAGFSGVLVVNFIKNIFEEFVWRGYLTTKLIQQKTSDFWLYLISGAVWGLWHLPYYLFFLPDSNIHDVLLVSRLLFAFIAVLAMIGWTVMFVELYRITNSIWSVVLLHTIEDSVINHLIFDGHISIAAGKEILISPILGIITTAFYLMIGLQLRKRRLQMEATI